MKTTIIVSNTTSAKELYEQQYRKILLDKKKRLENELAEINQLLNVKEMAVDMSVNVSAFANQLFIGVPKIQRAFDAVCTSFGVDKNLLKKDKSRKRQPCMCRHAVWKMIREDDPHITLNTLSDFFGGFDHSTVVHGINSVTNAMLTDDVLVKKYNKALALYLSNPTEYKEEYE